MAQHARLRIDTGLQVYFCDPHSPLYGVHGVKRHLLRADAVCWTGLGAASLLSGRRSAAPPCIRSALTGCLTNIPPTWAMRGRESRTHL
jgi:hypothetical protein